jgi:8-oxo-dGTP diphosphatase
VNAVDDLWYLASQANQRAEQAYHALTADRDSESYLEIERSRTVSRRRFRTLAERVDSCGCPFGAHTIVYRDSGELLLVRHDGVDLWVLPGGGLCGDESFREAAERELHEEAGIVANYDGLAMLTTVRFRSGSHEAWGVMPIFAAEAGATNPEVRDPDDEISDARWFETLPEDTRDRGDLVAWRDRYVS